jgi:hypothetical protein
MAHVVAPFQPALEHPSLSYNDFTIKRLDAYSSITIGTFGSGFCPAWSSINERAGSCAIEINWPEKRPLSSANCH